MKSTPNNLPSTPRDTEKQNTALHRIHVLKRTLRECLAELDALEEYVKKDETWRNVL